jgi:hypothetical protein
MKRNRRLRPPFQDPSAFAGFRFPPAVILLAVRWYLRYGLSYRDLDETRHRARLRLKPELSGPRPRREPVTHLGHPAPGWGWSYGFPVSRP